MKNLLNSIKRDFPEDSVYVVETLQQLNDELNSLMGKYENKSSNNNANPTYKNILEELLSIKLKINEVINDLDINYGQLIIGNTIDKGISSEQRLSRNYKFYKVDTTLEHSLEENLTHIRPFGFKFLSGDVIESKTWKEIFIKTCEILFNIDEEKFTSFVDKTRMNGEVRDYFSKYDTNIILPVKIMNKVYVTTGMSANGFRDLIIKMLKEYNFNVEDYKLYFAADYSPLHR